MAVSYELVSYDELAENPQQQLLPFASDDAAKGFAGKLAKNRGGPVDIARGGAGEWADRYLTTASPSEFHVKGFRFERLQ